MFADGSKYIESDDDRTMDVLFQLEEAFVKRDVKLLRAYLPRKYTSRRANAFTTVLPSNH